MGGTIPADTGAAAPSRERAAARESILSAARDLARREGWDAVTMRRLADEIEYSANFAYRYFTGRDDILLALVRDGFTRLATRWPPLATEPRPSCHQTRDGTVRASGEAVRRAAHAYLDFALTEPELYQLMYSLGGVRVPATDTWIEGQAIGEIFTDLLADAGDAQPEQHVLQFWATAHGLIALQVVGRVDVDPATLHTLLDDALTDCLARALPTPRRAGLTTRSRKDTTMNTLATGAAVVAILTTALIYGTDLFSALVVRPAAAGAADSSVADLLGRVHEYGDRRLPAPVSSPSSLPHSPPPPATTAQAGSAGRSHCWRCCLARHLHPDQRADQQEAPRRRRQPHRPRRHPDPPATLGQRHLAPRRTTSRRYGRAAHHHRDPITHQRAGPTATAASGPLGGPAAPRPRSPRLHRCSPSGTPSRGCRPLRPAPAESTPSQMQIAHDRARGASGILSGSACG